MTQYFDTEPARQYLINYLKETEQIFSEALLEYDKSATCKIYPSLDLGFPHDVARIAGGFATGSLVTWNCNIPFIPVDTTVNVCTSSVYEIENDITEVLNAEHFDLAIKKIGNSSYMLNYHRGNHFITLMRSMKSGKNYLVLHSSASEFKKTFNGLYPVENNWYIDDIKVFKKGNRYIRYITGKKAELFVNIAHQIEVFNNTRQDFIASTIVDKIGKINSISHHHHYYMPSDQSVMIGSFLLEPYEEAPIFTLPGVPIFIYKVHPSIKNRIQIDGQDYYLLPHGWGKTSKVSPEIVHDLSANTFALNGKNYPIEINSSLRDHPDLGLRIFSTEEGDDNYYFSQVGEYFDGEITDKLEQIFTYNKSGYKRWI